MSDHPLVQRLTSQLEAQGKTGARDMAIELLKKAGNLDAGGQLTAKGRERQAMGAEGRAKDRAAKASGGMHKPGDYAYDARTNRAKLRRRSR
jgi:hypothetical protein